ncbi:MAG: tetratricopeptide repeat protein [bacterium]|nr:MAG: tetratricopeptide repeat protein [bacterium]
MNRLAAVKKKILLIVLLLAASAAIFLAGAPSTEGDLYLDSGSYFRTLPFFHERSISWQKVRDVVLNNPYPGGKRFLPNLTFLLENYLVGFTASSGRWVNMAIHALNVLLVFFLLRRVLLLTGRREPEAGRGALAGSLLWGLNPFMADAVYYVIQRMTLMSTTFYLLAVLSYLRARETEGRKKWFWWAALAVSFTASVASKENGVLIVLGIAVLELTVPSAPIDRAAPLRKYLALAAAFAACSLLAMAFLGYNPVDVARGILSPGVAREFTAGERLLTEGRVLVDYLSREILPLPQRLSFVLKYRISRSPIDPPTTVLAWLAVVGLVFLAVRRRKQMPLFSLAVLWFFANHLLESTIIMLEIAFVHRNYLPTVFLFLPLTAWAASRREERKHFLAWSCVALVLLLFTYGTHSRARVWGSPERFWNDAVQKAPGSLRAYINLGILRDLAGREEEALKIYEQALRKGFEEKPGFWGDLYCNIGIALMDLGRYREAEQYMEKSLTVSKNDFYLFNMARLQRHLKNPDRGLDALGILEKNNPTFPGLHLLKAKLLADMGRHTEARVELVEELRLYPNNREARLLLRSYGAR